MVEFPTLGILGGGQLGRMTALTAIRLGVGIRFLAPRPAGPMKGIGEQMIGDWTAPDVLERFARGCTTVTVESEWAPAELLADVLPEGVALWPNPATLDIIRDKGRQKRCLADAGLPVPEFALCTTLEGAREAAERLDYPVVLKKLRGSYDGYGNATVRSAEGLPDAWAELASEDGLLVEEWVSFRRELSVLVARRPGGEHVIYPVAYTEQRDHRCHAVEVPAGVEPGVEEEARQVALAAVEAVGGVGITGVELFEIENGGILVNELAPRPHNTGHYSIEGSHTSQFENHVRAVLDWPLGSPDLREPVAVMVNILGHRSGRPGTDGLLEALSIPGVAVHIYGKQDVKPNRKMGHATATGKDPAETRARAERAAGLVRL